MSKRQLVADTQDRASCAAQQLPSDAKRRAVATPAAQLSTAADAARSAAQAGAAAAAAVPREGASSAEDQAGEAKSADDECNEQQPRPAPGQPARRLQPVRSSGFYGGSRLAPGRRLTQREVANEVRVQRCVHNSRQRHARWEAAEQAAAAAPIHQVWECFPTQQPAFDRADQEPGLEVFSVEFGSEGKRRFIAASRLNFWRRYRDMLPQHRHYYEIIRQGAPCHLYFDLEFQTADNPGLDGTAATDVVVALVAEQLLGSFQLHLQPSWVLELDSSTDAKFSRHLIVRIPGAAFASNAHVGAFVLQLCAAAREARAGDPRAALLIVRKGEEEALFVDPAVYSRNRAFRLYLSSKSGKQAVLHTTGRHGGAGLSQEQAFFASLITAVEPEARLLRCYEASEEEEAAAVRARRGAAAGVHAVRGVPRGTLGGGAAGPVNYGPCPHPELEAFINSVCCQGGAHGRVRSWMALRDDLMLFNIAGNRFCGNVGRQHKSNGIFYVADLQDGCWWQKCYDPECRHYRSPLTPLPPHLLGLMRPQHAQQDEPEEQQEWFESVDEDDLLMQAVDAFEQTQQRACVLSQQVQQHQQQPTHPAAAEPHGCAVQLAQQQPLQQPWAAGEPQPAGEPPDDDALLLQALLSYEQQQVQQAGQQQAQQGGQQPRQQEGQQGQRQGVATQQTLQSQQQQEQRQQQQQRQPRGQQQDTELEQQNQQQEQRGQQPQQAGAAAACMQQGAQALLATPELEAAAGAPLTPASQQAAGTELAAQQQPATATLLTPARQTAVGTLASPQQAAMPAGPTPAPLARDVSAAHAAAAAELPCVRPGCMPAQTPLSKQQERQQHQQQQQQRLPLWEVPLQRAHSLQRHQQQAQPRPLAIWEKFL